MIRYISNNFYFTKIAVPLFCLFGDFSPFCSSSFIFKDAACQMCLFSDSLMHFNSYPISICRYKPAGNYMFKVNSRNTRTRSEITSKLTIKTPEQLQWCRSVVFIINFEHILHLDLVFLLLTLSRQMLARNNDSLSKIM